MPATLAGSGPVPPPLSACMPSPGPRPPGSALRPPRSLCPAGPPALRAWSAPLASGLSPPARGGIHAPAGFFPPRHPCRGVRFLHSGRPGCKWFVRCCQPLPVWSVAHDPLGPRTALSLPRSSRASGFPSGSRATGSTLLHSPRFPPLPRPPPPPKGGSTTRPRFTASVPGWTLVGANSAAQRWGLKSFFP
jgi:hypothetical protein